jgi:hypothetical protein
MSVDPAIIAGRVIFSATPRAETDSLLILLNGWIASCIASEK